MRVVVDGSAPLWGQQLENQINAAIADAQRSIKPPRYTVATLPTNDSIRLAIVTNEVGGETLAFLDSAGVWRRATDLAAVSV